ncbi:MAG: endonuclease/exonuclease/phosphatase family protein [Actinomycetota bacterium]|nr:endonuclease/exonuclease/phosphatase family protein [Actinomycetota bacterium]
MTQVTSKIFVLAVAVMAMVAVAAPATATDHKDREGVHEGNDVARFATFNASLNRFGEGELIADLSTSDDVQAQAVAEIIQLTRPDVLLINEFDYDAAEIALGLFQDNYLSVSHNGSDPIAYPYAMAFSSNTGVPSGFDLDNSGGVGGPGDAFGFGFFEGQFAFVVYSMYEIAADDIRTFQNFLWKDMPGALLPDDPATSAPSDWYSPEELDVFRLSSKNHVDIPIEIGDRTVHFLVSHPTPPVFDGPEDRNGTRNHDEIRFWADYIQPSRSGYITDDDGGRGGLHPNARFVIAGDLNADPFDGDSTGDPAFLLLDNPKVNTKVTPSSDGGVEAADQGPPNDVHLGDPMFDTADFSEAAFGGPGNLRADYVLPRKSMKIVDAGIFWPTSDDPLFRLTGGGFPAVSSDHRLVWIDIHDRKFADD